MSSGFCFDSAVLPLHTSRDMSRDMLRPTPACRGSCSCTCIRPIAGRGADTTISKSSPLQRRVGRLISLRHPGVLNEPRGPTSRFHDRLGAIPMSRRFLTIVVIFAVTLGLAAVAQDATGLVSGLIRDSLGGAIPGATVRAVNEASGTSVEAVSDGQGSFRIAGLAPGEYRVEATLDGFETATRKVVLDAGQTAAVDLTLAPACINEGVVVTARRFEEEVQEVPIPVSVLSGELIANAGAFNVNRVKELIPTVQFYSSNPRNSTVTTPGMGAPFGLTNDGIEPGVGLYVDGIFYARPAAAALDFLDVERVEVLRGPQGTLFGKNTTAGAINVTSRRPGFKRESEA